MKHILYISKQKYVDGNSLRLRFSKKTFLIFYKKYIIIYIEK